MRRDASCPRPKRPIHARQRLLLRPVARAGCVPDWRATPRELAGNHEQSTAMEPGHPVEVTGPDQAGRPMGVYASQPCRTRRSATLLVVHSSRLPPQITPSRTARIPIRTSTSRRCTGFGTGIAGSLAMTQRCQRRPCARSAAPLRLGDCGNPFHANTTKSSQSCAASTRTLRQFRSSVACLRSRQGDVSRGFNQALQGPSRRQARPDGRG
jgi:hypothetical protein